jgi:hypothetical protein
MVQQEKLCAWHAALKDEIERRGGSSQQVPSLCAAEQNFFVDALEFAVSALLGLQHREMLDLLALLLLEIRFTTNA